MADESADPIGDTMRATLAEIHENEPAEVETADAPEVSDEPAPEGTRLRGPDGKFIPKNAATEEAPETASTPTQGSGPKPTPDTPQEQVAAPEHWSAEWKAKFDTLPPAGKALALEQSKLIEADYTRKTQAIKPLADLDSHFAPIYSRHGTSTAQVAASLLNTHVALLQGTPESRRQIFTELHRQFGVDFSPAQPGEQAQVDPVAQAVQAARAEYAPVLQTIQAQLAAAQDAQNLGTVQSFAQTKNPDGSLAYPHFDTVIEDMTFLMRSGRVPAGDMKAAYEQAVRLNPTTYAAELKKAATPKPAQTVGKVPPAVKKAAAATNMPKSAPGAKGNGVAGATMDETMRNRLAELRGSEA